MSLTSPEMAIPPDGKVYQRYWPFIPPDVAKKSPTDIEKWAENYLLKLMDLAAELNPYVRDKYLELWRAAQTEDPE